MLQHMKDSLKTRNNTLQREQDKQLFRLVFTLNAMRRSKEYAIHL